MLQRTLILVCAIFFLVVADVSQAQQYSWAGVWSTKYGVMTLYVRNGSVEGEYSKDGGEIEGVVAGNKLIGRWSEIPRTGPKDAGQIEFTMSADGRTFVGNWNYDGDQRWRTNWSGTRTTLIEDSDECKAARRKVKQASKKISEIKADLRRLSEGGRRPSPASRMRIRDRLNAATKKYEALKFKLLDVC